MGSRKKRRCGSTYQSAKVTPVMRVVACALKCATVHVRLRIMASTGAATGLAPTRLIVGPLSTQGGFQYWYLACFPDCVVAVQQSIGAFFVLGMSNSAGGACGLIGIVIKSLLQPRAQAFRQRIEAALQSTSSARLQVKPNVVYQTKQLKAIAYKLKSGAPLILSDLVLETKTGSKQRYGIIPADFEKVRSPLKQMYPALVNSI